MMEQSRRDRAGRSAQLLRTIGEKTSHEVDRLTDNALAEDLAQDIFTAIFDVLSNWSDDRAADVLKAVHRAFSAGRKPVPRLLRRWLEAHGTDLSSFAACLDVVPPAEIEILRLLSRAGSQKVVYLANWRITQQEVVLKRLIGTDNDRVLARELQPHPLSMSHPNIIKTHLLRNDRGESFLVEQLLPKVLNDAWRARGLHEASNLLRDIASALAFLHDKHLVHGDVKPDNIGIEEGYILLDFGICRPADAFTSESSATGSLRTRAPELIGEESPHSYASDVWALAATVFNALEGRFPLFDRDEKPPRVSHPSLRAEFQQELVRRVRVEFESRISFEVTSEPLRSILVACLTRNPSLRPSAAALVQRTQNELAAYLPDVDVSSGFSPYEELQQLSDFLPRREILRLMPDGQRQNLRARVQLLRSATETDRDVEKLATELLERLAE